MKKLSILTLSALTILSLAAPSLAGGARHQITITNLTSNQIFAPPLVAVHSSAADMFEVGQPASAGLALLAEDGDASMMASALAANPEVNQVIVAGGPVMPGASISLDLDLRGRYDRVSLASMLVTTNDAFVGLDSLAVDGHARAKGLRVMAPAYDAGSEFNSELCAYIPGPPCGNGGVRDTDGAEGYVYISSGIHGSGDLLPESSDWRNPVAVISISRR